MKGEEKYTFQIVTKARIYSMHTNSPADLLDWVQKLGMGYALAKRAYIKYYILFSDEKTALNVDNQLIAIAEERLMALQRHKAAKAPQTD